MTKYNVGDVLEITESFFLEGAQFKAGQKYTVEGVFAGYGGEDFYTLDDKESGYHFTNKVPRVDAHSGFRKVEPKVEFKVGDKVRLLEGAHSSPGYSCSTTEKVKSRLSTWGLDYQSEFTVAKVKDWEGDVYVSNGVISLYIMSEFLVPWVEDEEKPAEHMELGKTYQSTGNDFFYTPTEFDFESERVAFDFVSEPGSFISKSDRPFYEIELEFGVLPPVEPASEALDKLRERLNGVDISYSLGEPEIARLKATVEGETEAPETVSVDALREAMDYLGIQEIFDTENIISLAKRLS